jgi:chitodextrinase
VTGYEVFKDGVLAGSPTASPFDLTGLTASTTYSMTVKARDAAGNRSAASTAKSVTTLAVVDTTVPSTPTALASSAITPTSFTLKWTASTDNVAVTGYEIFKGGVLAGTSATPSFDVIGLVPATTYSMTVKAVDAAGNHSAASTAKSVKTTSDTIAPSAPTGLAATNVNETNFTLSWAAATDNIGVTGYDVIQNGIGAGSSVTTSLSVTGLSPGTVYVMYVYAKDAAGNRSGASTGLTVKTANLAPDADSDGDGLTNTEELALGTSRTNPDTDGDGINDGMEVALGTNPLVANAAPSLPLSGLSLFLRADLGVTQSAGAVSSWADRSGRGTVAVQSTAANQPQWVAADANGHPVIHVFGQQFLNAAGAMAGIGAADAFVVVKTTRPGSLWAFGTNGSKYTGPDGLIYDDFGTSAWAGRPKPTNVALNAYHIYNVTTAAAWTQRFNGKVSFSQALPWDAYRATTVIGDDTGFVGFTDLNIAEVIVYDHVLTDADRDSVNTYLTQRYALASVPQPTGLAATAVSTTQVSLGWSSVSTSAPVIYSLERQTGGGSWTPIAQLQDTLSYLDRNLTPGTTYNYRVKARLFTMESSYTPVASATTSNDGTPDLPLDHIRVWLKADAISSGPSVATWYDQSGLGNHAVAQRSPWPQLIPNAVNGKPAIQMSGSPFLFNNALAGVTEAEVFAVVKTGVPGQLWNLGSAPGMTRYPDGDHTVVDSFGSTTLATTPDPEIDFSSFHLYHVNSFSGEWAQHFNGNLNYVRRTNTVGFGSQSLAGGLNTEVAELIIYDRKLTDAERESVGFYLNAKYAFTSRFNFGKYRDSNGDGLTDEQDLLRGIDPLSLDSDGDGLSNAMERLTGTDPVSADTDGDGVPDNIDRFPLDPNRWQDLTPVPGDTTGPTITLIKPSTAILLP